MKSCARAQGYTKRRKSKKAHRRGRRTERADLSSAKRVFYGEDAQYVKSFSQGIRKGLSTAKIPSLRKIILLRILIIYYFEGFVKCFFSRQWLVVSG